jgi:hypothetical protein
MLRRPPPSPRQRSCQQWKLSRGLIVLALLLLTVLLLAEMVTVTALVPVVSVRPQAS